MTIDNPIQIRKLELVSYEGNVYTLDEYLRMKALQNLKENINMDKKIKKIETGVKKSEKGLKELERMDKKRDPACEMGEKMMKKKKKK